VIYFLLQKVSFHAGTIVSPTFVSRKCAPVPCSLDHSFEKFFSEKVCPNREAQFSRYKVPTPKKFPDYFPQAIHVIATSIGSAAVMMDN